MTNSEQRSQVALTIRTADPETEILLQDSRFQVQARGTGSLTKTLDEGLYKVKLRAGLDTFEDHLVLRGQATVVKEYPPLHFTSSAPLANTARTHEYHREAAIHHSRIPHVVLGQGSSIFVFARDWTRDEQAAATMPSHPAAGLALVSLAPGDAVGQPLVDFAQASVVGSQKDAWAACNVRVNPGFYRMRLTVPDREVLEQTIVATSEWQTQIFLLQRNYEVPSGSSVVQSSASRPGQCPDLSGASVFMARGEGFIENSQLARHAEFARLALIGRGRVLTQKVRAILSDKFENPMLGIFGAHLLLMEPTPDRRLLDTVVSNLRMLLGHHPDVEAIALALEDPMSAPPFVVPPMLRQSWSLIVQATARRPDLVPPGSLTAGIAERILRDDPWLIWRSLSDPTIETDDEPSALEDVLETYLRPRRRSSRRQRAERGGLSKDIPSFEAPMEQAETLEVDDARMSSLVQSLQLPRSQVEQLVEKVKRRPPRAE